jgi:hypothetical protein
MMRKEPYKILGGGLGGLPIVRDGKRLSANGTSFIISSIYCYDLLRLVSLVFIFSSIFLSKGEIQQRTSLVPPPKKMKTVKTHIVTWLEMATTSGFAHKNIVISSRTSCTFLQIVIPE